jgi:hypothetical protein
MAGRMTKYLILSTVMQESGSESSREDFEYICIGLHCLTLDAPSHISECVSNQGIPIAKLAYYASADPGA